jgi:rod shape-determining protein MreB
VEGQQKLPSFHLGGIVYSKSVRVAGDKFDEAISSIILRKNILFFIGERTAEAN